MTRIILSKILIVLLTVSCGEKVNRIHSKSIVESKESGFFISQYALLTEDQACTLNYKINCWSEKAWTFEYGLMQKPVKVDLDFYNFFLEIDNGIKNDVQFLNPLEKKWNNSSYIIEPKLGNYFQCSSIEDSIFVRINNLNKDCTYFLKEIE